MTNFLDIPELINYGLVTIYGFGLSIAFSGGYKNERQKHLSVFMLAALLLLQAPFRFIMGTDFTKQIYPVLVHLPLALILIFILKKSVGISIVSVCTAYSCCQFPRWISVAVLAVTSSKLISDISYTLVIIPIFILLYRFFAKYAYAAMTYSRRALILFGILPIAYYIFDYTTTIYTHTLYSGIYAISEALPTVCMLFYIGFISLYHAEVQKRAGAEYEKSALALELKQAETEITAMKMIQEQNAVFRHDLRHHINLLSTYLENNDIESAKAYIRQARADADKITPTVYSDNNIINFTLSYFALKAEKKDVQFHCKANVPENINIPDTDLSAILSNALENAVKAAAEVKNATMREVSVLVSFKKNKLLISIANSYSGKIESDGELPSNNAAGHGFGVKSIKAIAERHNGLCSFEWDNKIFKTRIVMSI